MQFKIKGKGFGGGGSGGGSLIHLNTVPVIIFNHHHSQNVKYSLCVSPI